MPSHPDRVRRHYDSLEWSRIEIPDTEIELLDGAEPDNDPDAQADEADQSGLDAD